MAGLDFLVSFKNTIDEEGPRSLFEIFTRTAGDHAITVDCTGGMKMANALLYTFTASTAGGGEPLFTSLEDSLNETIGENFPALSLQVSADKVLFQIS